MKSLLALTLTVACLQQTVQPAHSATAVSDAQGIRYLLPDGWTAKRLNRGVKLLPAGSTEAEAYIAMKFEWGFTRADREKILEKFDVLAKSLAPYLKRAGDGWLKSANGPVVVLKYIGRAPDGSAQTGHCYLASMGGYAIVVLAAGDNSLVAKRAQDVRAIFLSAVRGQTSQKSTANAKADTQKPAAGDIDRQVVGRWIRRENTSSTGGGGYAASGTTYTFTFTANGTCSLRVATWISASAGGSGAFSGPGNGKTYSGRWSAKNGRLVVQFSDGSKLQNSYKVFSHLGKPVLKLFLPGGKPVYYRR